MSTPRSAERDYVMAHVVSQLHRAHPEDGGRLVFKGGTALRLFHMRDYRYSADLDFTIAGGDGTHASLAALSVAVEAARTCADFPTLEVTADATGLEYVGPLGSAKPRRIKVDMAIIYVPPGCCPVSPAARQTTSYIGENHPNKRPNRALFELSQRLPIRPTPS